MTTPTGIPIIQCTDCGLPHPETRKHCAGCNVPSIFLRQEGVCSTCARIQTERHADGKWWALCINCTHPYGVSWHTKTEALHYYATTPICHECKNGEAP